MSFLHPALLAFLAAATVPYVLHRWGPRAAARLPFGATELLRAAPPPRRRRLDDLWLWALRTGVVVLAVLLLARPQLRAAQARPDAAPLPLAQVVDVSGSMAYRLGGGGSLLEAAQRLASLDAAGHAAAATAATAAGASSTPPVVVVAAGARPILLTPPGGGGPTEVEQSLRQLVQEAGEGDLAAAARQALAALPAGPARLVIYSDLAANALAPLARPRAEEAARWREIQLQLVDAAGRPPEARRTPLPNLALAAASLHFDPLDAAAWRVKVTVRNFGHLAARRVPIRLSANGRLLQQAHLDVPAADAAERTLTQRFDGPPPESLSLSIVDGSEMAGPAGRASGAASGRSVAAGGLPQDNGLSLLARPISPLRLLVVAPSPRPVAWADPLAFIEAAAAATPADEVPIQLTAVGAQEAWPLFGPARPDVVWLTDLGRLGGDKLAELAAFVDAGGGLGVALGPTVNPDAAHPAWGPLLARPLRAVRQLVGPQGEVAPVGVGLGSSGAALLRGLDPRIERQLAASRTHTFVDVEGSAGADVLLYFRALGGDAPALLAAHQPPAGRRLLWTSSLDCSWGDLALQPAFVPLMQRLLRHLAGRPAAAAAGAAALRVGDQIALVPPAGAQAVRLSGPDGARLEAEVDGHLNTQAAGDAGAGATVRLGVACAPGLWRAEVRGVQGWRREAELDQAIWPSLAESDYVSMDPAALTTAWRLEGMAHGGGARRPSHPGAGRIFGAGAGDAAGLSAGAASRALPAALAPLLVATAILECCLSASRRRG